MVVNLAKPTPAKPGSPPWQIPAIYALVGILWILLSDYFLARFVPAPVPFTSLQTVKGWLYVAITTILLYLLIRRNTAAVRRSAAALWESERTLATLMSNLPGMAYRCRNERDWPLEFASQGCFDLTGYQPSDLIDNTPVAYGDLIHPADRENTRQTITAALAARRPFQHVYRLITAAGEEKWVWEQGRGVYGPDGKAVYLEGFITDVTETKRAEAQLQQRNRELAALTQTHRRLITALEQAAESVLITDVTGAIVYVNPAFERISGYTRAEVLGQNPRILQSGQHDGAFYQSLWATLTAGQVWRGRFVNRHKTGTLYTVEATISPVRDEQGEIINYVAVRRDVTAELQREEQYRQAQKMEAMGRLAGGVAHDFNNILTVISGYTGLLLNSSRAEAWRQDIEHIRAAADQATALVRQLLAFSRNQVLQPRVLDLNRIVAGVEKMLRRLIGEDIELATKLAAELGRVKADPGQLEQVIVNLAVNARDAMPEGGRLILATANVDLAETGENSLLNLVPGPYVLLEVSDTGVGMTPEVQSHLFEPFFTTKEPGKGTGLGLATVFGIIKQSGGEIEVESVPGQGATFKIYLPRLVDAPTPAPTEPGSYRFPRGTETILLVEDETAVRELAYRVLTLGGYTVLAADSGLQALALAEEYAGSIDLLVTDVVMPEMNGRRLAEQLAEARPRLKTLYISGYTDEVIAQHGLLKPGQDFLNKPFSPTILAGKVREILDKGQEGQSF